MEQTAIKSRRKFLKNVGYISVSFSLLSACKGESIPEIAGRIEYNGKLPKSLNNAKNVNAWLEILEDGSVIILSGKVELGQGIKTAIQQVAAEELDMDFNRVSVHLAETGVTPNEGYTAASSSVLNSAMSVRYAAATARAQLISMASKKLNQPENNLVLYNGQVLTKTGSDSVTFQELINGEQIDVEVTLPIKIKDKSKNKYVGKAIPRDDISKMVTGEYTYIHDLRFPDMIHGGIVRPPTYNGTFISYVDKGMDFMIGGIIKIVQKGNFLAVLAESEYQAVKAASYLKHNSKWETSNILPKQSELYHHIEEIADAPKNIKDEGDVNTEFQTGETFKATFTKPYIKHGSIGPACAIAMFDGDILHIWSHSQGIYPLREALSAMLDMDQDHIHIISAPGAGCFGHSTADDAAADAAVLALEMPNKHIRVQWSRNDENGWDPFGTAIISKMEAKLNADGKIAAWQSDVWTDSHSTRPNSDGGTVLTARYLDPPILMQSRGYLGGGHRNGDPYYAIPNMKLNAHFFDGPLRVSSLRSLGAYANIYAIESFMDVLAEKADNDPIQFRIDHLEDDRAIAVIQKVKKMTTGVSTDAGEGIGYGFMRYKNSDAYAAVAAKVRVNEGQVSIIKMWGCIDVGEVINIDGLKNQTEGGMLQAASWTLKEQVIFNSAKVTSIEWGDYPVFRFNDIPEVEVAVIDRPNVSAVGGGEAALPPSAAAIGNAVYRATGKRVYDLPITPEKLMS